MHIKGEDEARQRGMRAGQAAQRQARLNSRVCDWCGVSLAGRHFRAKSCSREHRNLAYKAANLKARREAHPFCPVCGDPMPIRTGNGQRVRTTCSRKCSNIRWRWFGPMNRKKR